MKVTNFYCVLTWNKRDLSELIFMKNIKSGTEISLLMTAIIHDLQN